MTDNTEELDDILDTLAEKSADSDSSLGYVEAYEFAQEAKQAILDWHNKQVEAVLDRLEAQFVEEVVVIFGKTEVKKQVPLSAIEAERTRLRGDAEDRSSQFSAFDEGYNNARDGLRAEQRQALTNALYGKGDNKK